jgi:transposase
MSYYVEHIFAVQPLNWSTLKYMDEASFSSKELEVWYGFAPVNERLNVRRPNSENVTYSLSITTSLANGGAIHIGELRRNTNTSDDFLSYVYSLLVSGFIGRGDYLLCDNAPIHKAAEITAHLDTALNAAGVRLIYIPKYSPELNPCELVFSKAKSELRYRRGNQPFATEIMRAFSAVTARDLVRFYIESIDAPVRA